MIETLKNYPIYRGDPSKNEIVGYTEPTLRETWQKLNEVIEHINKLEEK